MRPMQICETFDELCTEIDRAEKTSLVNGYMPLGDTIWFDNARTGPARMTATRDLMLPDGVILSGMGAGTVLDMNGYNILLKSVSPDNGYAPRITLEKAQIRGGNFRKHPDTTVATDIQLNNLDLFDFHVETGPDIAFGVQFNSVNFHEWKRSTIKGNFRVTSLRNCKWLDANVTTNEPAIDIEGEDANLLLDTCQWEFKGTFFRVKGARARVTLINAWPEEPRPFKVGPLAILDGPGAMLYGDVIVASTVNPVLFQNGARAGDAIELRATRPDGVRPLPSDKDYKLVRAIAFKGAA